MAECDHCGAYVSDEFARVFSAPDGQLEACLNCASKPGIAAASWNRIHEDR